MHVILAAFVYALCSSPSAAVAPSHAADTTGLLRGASRSLMTDYETIEFYSSSCTREPGVGPTYNATQVQADLDAARAKWGDRQDYDFSYTQSCFCWFTSLAFPYTVSVRDGLVESVIDSDGLPVPCDHDYVPNVTTTLSEDGEKVETITSVPECTQAELQGLAKVIEKQFDYIQNAIDNEYCRLSVVYDEILGYPMIIQSKYGGPYLADDGTSYTNGNLIPYYHAKR